MADDFAIRLDHAQISQLLTGSEVARDLMSKALGVETTAKQLCPVDTGRLRSSINTGLHVDSEGLVAVVGTDVEYAVHIEYGTSKMAPQAFLRPALEIESKSW